MRLILLRTASLAVACLVGTSWLSADSPYPNTEPASSGAPMDPAEAAAGTRVPPGFSCHVFAAEPDVQNPIAMTWDRRGRLWVAENYTYAERAQRFDLSLKDRVVIFEGTDENRFTRRTVFTDEVQMLTGVEVTDDGVYLMCPPRLLFLPDRDQDDVPDGPAETVLDGFSVGQANYHNFANGIRFGPDGWLYGRCGGSCPGRVGKPGTPDEHRVSLEGGIWRYHVRRQQFEVLTTGTTNPWGHDFNAYGEGFFVNTVNGHLWHLIPGAHFTRPFTLDPQRETYELIDFHADHWHFDTGRAWHESRDGVANDFGGGHAHSGALIYDDVVWPEEFWNQLFTLNFHGRRVNQEHLVRRGSGYVGTHRPDRFLASDPWFRGMDLSVGPDGNVFVIDWSDAGECHEHDGVHRTSGRIYKWVYEASDLPERVSPNSVDRSDRLDADQVYVALMGSSQWARQMAIKTLATRAMATQTLANETGDSRPEAFDSRLAQLLTRGASSESAVVRCRCLLAEHAIGRTSESRLRECLRDPSEHVRTWAIRLITESWPIDDAMGARWKSETLRARVAQESAPWINELVELATSDPSAMVRLALASTLQRLPTELRSRLATALVGHEEDADDHNLPKMVWYGMIPVAQRFPDAIAEVIGHSRLPKTTQLMTRHLAESIDTHPEAIDAVLRDAGSRGGIHRQAVLDGLTDGFAGRQRAELPEHWPAFAAAMGDGNDQVRSLSTLFGDGRALDELRDIVAGRRDADDASRTAALQSLIRAEPDDLRDLCLGLLKNSKLNVVAAGGLAKFDDPEVARVLVARYRNFRAPARPQLISILVSRPTFARPLLDAIADEKIPRDALTAFDVRQIDSLQDSEISDRVREVWGEVRTTPAEQQEQIESLKSRLTADVLASADKSHGRTLFNRGCKSCHRLYGEGELIGPDLTGSGRANLDYLLTNIVAPDAVVDKNFRMTVFLLDDGRVINGLVLDQSPVMATVQTATEKVTIPGITIERQKLSDHSPMPSGLLNHLSEDDIRDLIGYLQHPTQVPLEAGN